ncbi:MAG: SulP family inorganic anion transporter [Piscinibacter sp.]
MNAEHQPPPWPREILGGAVGSAVMLAVVLTIGMLGFAPLGPSAAATGITAAFVSATVGGLLVALFGASALPVGGPSSATALIFAGALVPLLQEPAVAASAGVAPVLAAGGLLVTAAGLLQLLFAQVGLGRMAQFVPQPVLAGFMNGVAVLIFVSQVPALLGLRVGEAWGAWQAAPLALGLCAAACAWVVSWRWRNAPAQLIGLLVGLGLHALLQTGWPSLPLGPIVGPMPSAVPVPDLPLAWIAPATAGFLRRHALDLLTAATVLALIGSLESVLSGMAIDQQLDARHDAGRDLRALGLANVVVGLFGGLPVVVLRARALATLHAGGRGRRAALAGALAFGLMYFTLGPLIARLPNAVLAGIMLTVAVALVDRWTRQLVAQWRGGERSADLWQALAVVAFVCAVTVWKGFAVGVAAGVLAALAIFVRGVYRSLLRSAHTAAEAPSRRLYPPAQAAFLAGARRRIAVLELEGALFFGSAGRLADALDRLPADAKHVIVDLSGASTIDASGAMLLQRASTAHRRQGRTLLLAGVRADGAHARRLHAYGCFREMPRDDWFADADRAVEWAEQQLLAEAGLALNGDTLALEASTLFEGLSSEAAARLRAGMRRRELARGERLFREGDAGDGLYVLTRGSITVETTAGQRFLSFSPGLMLGETAMLDGGGRSASAVADADAELWQLTPPALEALARESPELAAQLYRRIAVHLAQRLRHGTAGRTAAAAPTN